MHRRLFAGGLDLFVSGVQLGDPQVVFDAVVKQMGFLGDKASISRRFFVLMSATFVPESSTLPFCTSQNRMNSLSKVDFPLPLRPTMPTTLCSGISTDTSERMVSLPVGKGNVLRRRARESDFRPAGDFLHDRGFVQDVQHPVARRKGVL